MATAKKPARRDKAPDKAERKQTGRPSKYKPEFVAVAEAMAKLGATDQEMADAFTVDVRTFYRWRNEHEAFCHALKQGKDVADARVERSLYQMATGYEQDEVKIFMPGGADKPVYAPYRARIAPNVTACIFWLKNRRPDDWREKREDDKPADDTAALLGKLIDKLPG